MLKDVYETNPALDSKVRRAAKKSVSVYTNKSKI